MREAPRLAQQYRELEILNEIAGALNESVSLADSLGATLSRVAEFLNLQAGWVWLFNETTGQPYLAAAQNLPAALAEYPERMAGSCYCLGAFRRGALRNAANVFACSRLEWLTEGTAGLRFHASVPLHARGKRLGVMNVASTEWRELSTCELRLLHTIGEMLGVAIERSRLFEQSARTGATEERNRLAREIHDTLAQGLAATALQLETVDALLELDPTRIDEDDLARARAAVRRALQLTRQNLDDTRRSVLDLRPAPLEGRSLVDALRALCQELTQDQRRHDAGTSANGAVHSADTGHPTDTSHPAAVGHSSNPSPRIDFQARGETRPIPARLEAGVYRIAREALANALRHAAATNIVVQLVITAERIQLIVEDDGRGFETDGYSFDLCANAPQTDDRAAHFGVAGMYERARLLDGELTLQSAPGEGTRVEAVIPLEPSAHALRAGQKAPTSLPDPASSAAHPAPDEATCPARGRPL
jgi:two-component system NarL family sensor kinase